MFITNYVYYSAVSPFPCQNWATLIFANFGTVLGFELRALYLPDRQVFYHLSHSTSPVCDFFFLNIRFQELFVLAGFKP
jgi:hypothetical protein